MLIEVEDGAAEGVGGEALPSFLLLAGLFPVERSQLEDPAAYVRRVNAMLTA